MSKTYKFKTSDEASYNSLAAYVVTMPVTVTLFPQSLTIAISEDASKEVGEFIDNEALKFSISVADIEADDINKLLDDPTSDTSILREIAKALLVDKNVSAELYKKNIDAVTKERGEVILALENTKKDMANISRWWRQEQNKNERIHKQIEAIAVLLDSILPKQ